VVEKMASKLKTRVSLQSSLVFVFFLTLFLSQFASAADSNWITNFHTSDQKIKSCLESSSAKCSEIIGFELGSASGVKLTALYFLDSITEKTEVGDYYQFDVSANPVSFKPNVVVVYEAERFLNEPITEGFYVRGVRIPKTLFEKAFKLVKKDNKFFLMMQNDDQNKAGEGAHVIYFSGSELDAAFEFSKASKQDKQKFEENSRVIFGIDSVEVGTTATLHMDPNCDKMGAAIKHQINDNYYTFDFYGVSVKNENRNTNLLFPLRLHYWKGKESEKVVKLALSFSVPKDWVKGAEATRFFCKSSFLPSIMPEKNLAIVVGLPASTIKLPSFMQVSDVQVANDGIKLSIDPSSSFDDLKYEIKPLTVDEMLTEGYLTGATIEKIGRNNLEELVKSVAQTSGIIKRTGNELTIPVSSLNAFGAYKLTLFAQRFNSQQMFSLNIDLSDLNLPALDFNVITSDFTKKRKWDTILNEFEVNLVPLTLNQVNFRPSYGNPTLNYELNSLNLINVGEYSSIINAFDKTLPFSKISELSGTHCGEAGKALCYAIVFWKVPGKIPTVPTGPIKSCKLKFDKQNRRLTLKLTLNNALKGVESILGYYQIIQSLNNFISGEGEINFKISTDYEAIGVLENYEYSPVFTYKIIKFNNQDVEVICEPPEDSGAILPETPLPVEKLYFKVTKFEVTPYDDEKDDKKDSITVIAKYEYKAYGGARVDPSKIGAVIKFSAPGVTGLGYFYLISGDAPDEDPGENLVWNKNHGETYGSGEMKLVLTYPAIKGLEDEVSRRESVNQLENRMVRAAFVLAYPEYPEWKPKAVGEKVFTFPDTQVTPVTEEKPSLVFFRVGEVSRVSEEVKDKEFLLRAHWKIDGLDDSKKYVLKIFYPVQSKPQIADLRELFQTTIKNRKVAEGGLDFSREKIGGASFLLLELYDEKGEELIIEGADITALLTTQVKLEKDKVFYFIPGPYGGGVGLKYHGVETNEAQFIPVKDPTFSFVYLNDKKEPIGNIYCEAPSEWVSAVQEVLKASVIAGVGISSIYVPAKVYLPLLVLDLTSKAFKEISAAETIAKQFSTFEGEHIKASANKMLEHYKRSLDAVEKVVQNAEVGGTGRETLEVLKSDLSILEDANKVIQATKTIDLAYQNRMLRNLEKMMKILVSARLKRNLIVVGQTTLSVVSQLKSKSPYAFLALAVIDAAFLAELQSKTPGEKFALTPGGDYVGCNGFAAVKAIKVDPNTKAVFLTVVQMFVPDEEFLKNFAATMGEDYYVKKVYRLEKSKTQMLLPRELAFLPNGWSIQLIKVNYNIVLADEAEFIVRDNNGLIVDCNTGFGMAMDVDDGSEEKCGKITISVDIASNNYVHVTLKEAV